MSISLSTKLHFSVCFLWNFQSIEWLTEYSNKNNVFPNFTVTNSPFIYHLHFDICPFLLRLLNYKHLILIFTRLWADGLQFEDILACVALMTGNKRYQRGFKADHFLFANCELVSLFHNSFVAITVSPAHPKYSLFTNYQYIWSMTGGKIH